MSPCTNPDKSCTSFEAASQAPTGTVTGTYSTRTHSFGRCPAPASPPTVYMGNAPSRRAETAATPGPGNGRGAVGETRPQVSCGLMVAEPPGSAG
jgi:hypothetical protein